MLSAQLNSDMRLASTTIVLSTLLSFGPLSLALLLRRSRVLCYRRTPTTSCVGAASPLMRLRSPRSYLLPCWGAWNSSANPHTRSGREVRDGSVLVGVVFEVFALFRSQQAKEAPRYGRR